MIGGTRQIEIAEGLLSHFGGDIRRLYQAHPDELAKIRGISQVNAIRLKAALSLGQRLSAPNEERPTINSPADAAALVQNEMGLLEQEHLRVLLLDTRNHVLEIVEVYQGSVNTSQVRIAEIFKMAIRRNATALIVVHNHPSTDPTPSPDDVAITKVIRQAGQLLDVELIDHLVIGGSRWVSLKERGLGFN